MTTTRLAYWVNVALGLASALLAPSAYAQREPQKFIQIADDFSRDSANWLAAFTDYNLINSVPHRIAEIRTLPPYIDASRRAFYLQAVNDSDDLFSFLKKPITPDDGIEPNAIYEVSFLVEFASNASTECAGLGGAPGLDVYLKVGASATEPVATLVGEKLTFNLDKGNQAEGGRDATVAGHIGVINDECDPEKARFVLAERRQKHTQRVRASSFGWLWLFVGADSGYEGLNQLYYSRIVVTLTRVEGGAR